METSPLFLPAKTIEFGAETILEHGFQVMGVGRFLYDTLKPEFDRNKYLWACLFHDAGKSIAPPGSHLPHGPATREGIDRIKTTDAYREILNRLNLPDYSDDNDTIACMSQHHNLDTGAHGMTIHISAADMIASGAHERNEKQPANPALTAYWNHIRLRKTRFVDLSVFNPSKNELVSIGKAMMLSLLLEAVEEIDGITLLYLHSHGCRIATEKDDQSIRDSVRDQFNTVFMTFLKGQEIGDLMVGAGQGYGQLQTLPQPLRELAITGIINKYAGDIVKNAFDLRKQKKSEILTDDMLDDYLSDLGLSRSILERFAGLDALLQLTTNIAGTKINLMADHASHIDPAIAARNNIKETKKLTFLEGAEPKYLKLLELAGADKNRLTKCYAFEGILPGFAVAIKQFQQNTPAPAFDLNDYLAVNGKIPFRPPSSHVCANCGAYPGEIDLSMIAFREQQHLRETIFRLTNANARQGHLKVCGLCNCQALLNTFLSGVEVDRNQARIRLRTHAIFIGIHIGESITARLETENELLYQRLSKGYKVLEKHILTNGPNRMEMVALSFSENDNGITNRTYRHLLFSDIADMVTRHIPGILAIGINYVPEHFNPFVLQMEDGVVPIINDHRLTFFRWVEYAFKLAISDKVKRDYILQYAHQPLIGLNQLIRRETRNWQSVLKSIEEEFDKMVTEMDPKEKNMYHLAQMT
jgi:hypothetical protein